MAVEDILTFDLPIPRRAAFADIFYSLKEDEPGYEVREPTALSSTEMNQLVRLMEAVNRTMPIAILSVRFTAGAPEVFRLTVAGTEVITTTLTVTHVGPGEVTIVWPANTFPPPLAEPIPALNDLAGRTIGATSLPNGVTVMTRDALTNAPADAAFSVLLF